MNHRFTVLLLMMACGRVHRPPGVVDAEVVDAVPIDAVGADAVPVDAAPVDAVPVDAAPVVQTFPVGVECAGGHCYGGYNGVKDAGGMVDATWLCTTHGFRTSLGFTISFKHPGGRFCGYSPTSMQFSCDGSCSGCNAIDSVTCSNP